MISCYQTKFMVQGTRLLTVVAVTKGTEIAEDFGPASGWPPSEVIFQTAEDGMSKTIKPGLEKLGADS
jgi:hypothetical protein